MCKSRGHAKMPEYEMRVQRLQNYLNKHNCILGFVSETFSYVTFRSIAAVLRARRRMFIGYLLVRSVAERLVALRYLKT